MAFFLIGRGPEDDLRVLSESFFDSRQEAMAELSRISAEPGFTQWDTDVFVLDLEQGVPVLLVRPHNAELPITAAVSPEAEEDVVDDTGGAGAWEADEAVEPVAPIGVIESVTSEDASEPSPESAENESDDLRSALQRTADHMSAEGIVPPPSAGLTAAEEAAESELPEEPEGEDEDDVQGEAEGAVAEASAQTDVDSETESAWPWAAPAATPDTESESVSPDIAGVYEALEEPAPAVSDSLESSGASQEEAAEAPQADDSDFILDLDAIQPVALDGNPAAETQDETPEIAEPALEAPVATPGEDAYSSSLTEYTCEDCVYVETCPNRDQRAPKDCGSFQWK